MIFLSHLRLDIAREKCKTAAMFWRSASIIAVSSVLAAVATLTVTLRFLAKRLQHLSIGPDDYLLVASLVGLVLQ